MQHKNKKFKYMWRKICISEFYFYSFILCRSFLNVIKKFQNDHRFILLNNAFIKVSLSGEE